MENNNLKNVSEIIIKDSIQTDFRRYGIEKSIEMFESIFKGKQLEKIKYFVDEIIHK